MGPVVGTFLLVPVGEMTRVVFEGGGTGTSLVALLNEKVPALKSFRELASIASGGGGGLATALWNHTCGLLPRIAEGRASCLYQAGRGMERVK